MGGFEHEYIIDFTPLSDEHVVMARPKAKSQASRSRSDTRFKVGDKVRMVVPGSPIMAIGRILRFTAACWHYYEGRFIVTNIPLSILKHVNAD